MSSVFKKTCFECGKKEDKLYESLCEECLVEKYPPVKDIKPMNFKIDNVSKEICYNNIYYTFDKLIDQLPSIVKKHIVLHDQYVLKHIEIENPEVKGHKLIFDIEIECDVK